LNASFTVVRKDNSVSGLIWSLWFERDEAIDSGKMEKGSAEQLMPVHVEA